ncbi:hypothetical protein [Streptomyces sp. AB3(2024)]|uniref:hypothetical protein n=1 Tax=Streptomyces sp. AB3(2024) TaxID=3317321 RepID=UPI0035A31476
MGFYSLVLEPAEVDLAFVSDEAQGTGVGGLLMEHMLDQAQSEGLTGVRVVSPPRRTGSTCAWALSGSVWSPPRRRRPGGNVRSCDSPCTANVSPAPCPQPFVTEAVGKAPTWTGTPSSIVSRTHIRPACQGNRDRAATSTTVTRWQPAFDGIARAPGCAVPAPPPR